MHCHESTPIIPSYAGNCIALIGHPNVGKSALFQHLTGKQVAISNYPGTTVEVSRGTAREIPEATIIDTPGLIAFPPHTEDEQVTARLLFSEALRAIVHVGDAKNIHRTIQLSIQLAEMGIPLVLALNMTDEANTRGVKINYEIISKELSAPIVPTTAVRGLGVHTLTDILKTVHPSQFRLDYPIAIEKTLAEIIPYLPKAPISPRSIALLWLSEDAVADSWIRRNVDPETYQLLTVRKDLLKQSSNEPILSLIQQTRLVYAEQVASKGTLETGANWQSLSTKLGQLTTHPIWGMVILAAVLYGLYWFVGVFGAGTLVDLLETKFFGELINPWLKNWISHWVPLAWISDFLVGEYGLWTMGITYALALILPIVSTFFLAFGIMEDTGYLPRLATLSNRLFTKLGLNGKAVLPMILGLGCVTMATLTTRVLENKRERLLVTLLLALAIPCSAQLGVVMGLLAGISLNATLIWSGVVFAVLLATGWLAAKLVPGERSLLLIELPPLRWPIISNVILKTTARLEWYLKEVVPLFLLGTALMFVLDKTGALQWMIRASEPLVTGWLGLPPEASAAFLMGFLRRDFGATGLFVIESQGLLSPSQVVVAMTTVTLFIPCIASVMVISKERGWRQAVGILIVVFPLAFLVGGLLNRALTAIGWGG